ncbi:MAG: sigma-70 family RNA polymerase sigma factor [Thermoleophilia bacterium]|nr:sigma-70 family RNA polymerase sigma factor [Thermoleophilia bacterium]
MDERDALARRFEAARPHLEGVARRVLGIGDPAGVADALQEAWLRLERVDAGAIDNLEGWLTTVVARIAIDTRRGRRDIPSADPPQEAAPDDPERDAVLADVVGQALDVVVGRMGPRERVAFVLHDVFGYAFADIAAMTGTTPAATRQAASRARRRIGEPAAGVAAPASARRALVDAFLAASREGDVAGLVALLAPGATLTADPATMAMGAARYWGGSDDPDAPLARGADAVARAFSGRAQAAEPALIDAEPGAVWRHGGRVRVAFAFDVVGDRIAGIRLVADPAAHAAMRIETPGREGGPVSPAPGA